MRTRSPWFFVKTVEFVDEASRWGKVIRSRLTKKKKKKNHSTYGFVRANSGSRYSRFQIRHSRLSIFPKSSASINEEFELGQS